GVARDFERSVLVRRVAKVSLTFASGSRSQARSRPTKKRTLRSARTTGEGVNGIEPAARRNSSSVMSERIRGKSTAHTSCNGMPARKSWTRRGSRSNSCVETCGIGPSWSGRPAQFLLRRRDSDTALRLREEVHQSRGIEIEHLGTSEFPLMQPVEPEDWAV